MSGLTEWCALTGRNPLEVLRSALTGTAMPAANTWLSLGQTPYTAGADAGAAAAGAAIDNIHGGAQAGAAAAAAAGGGPAVGRNADGRRNTIVSYARAQLGKPYQWDKSGPSSFDCSGLTMEAYDQVGISLIHYTIAQENDPRGHTVSLQNALPGDLCFWGTASSHVAVYIGGGQMIEAPKTGENVRISQIREHGTSGDLRLRSFFKDN